MRARQVSRPHQKRMGDLAAGKAERLLEQLDPFFLRQRMMGIQPRRKAAMAVPHLTNTIGIGYRSINLEAIADDPGIFQKPFTILGTVISHPIHFEPFIGSGEAFPLLQDGQPAQTCLVNLEDQALKQDRLVTNRIPVFGIVVRPVPFMAQ